MIINNKAIKTGDVLPINETFYSIQGEGYHVGEPAFFIRIGGCDISCSWCDTKYSWEADSYNLNKVENIVTEVLNSPIRSVIITGGEPTLFNLRKLTKSLKQNKIKIFLETTGAYPINGNFDWICLSPKQNKPPLSTNYKFANELKIIIHNLISDFKWAEQQSKLISPDCKLYLQPEWSCFEKNKKTIIQYIKNNPKWNLSIQLHKFLKIP